MINWVSLDRSSTQYYNVHVQYTEGVACGYHKVKHLRLRIYSLHSNSIIMHTDWKLTKLLVQLQQYMYYEISC